MSFIQSIYVISNYTRFVYTKEKKSTTQKEINSDITSCNKPLQLFFSPTLLFIKVYCYKYGVVSPFLIFNLNGPFFVFFKLFVEIQFWIVLFCKFGLRGEKLNYSQNMNTPKIMSQNIFGSWSPRAWEAKLIIYTDIFAKNNWRVELIILY